MGGEKIRAVGVARQAFRAKAPKPSHAGQKARRSIGIKIRPDHHFNTNPVGGQFLSAGEACQ